jgi:hypothetical protein
MPIWDPRLACDVPEDFLSQGMRNQFSRLENGYHEQNICLLKKRTTPIN